MVLTGAGEILTSSGDSYIAKVTGACGTLTSSGCRCYYITEYTKAENVQKQR